MKMRRIDMVHTFAGFLVTVSTILGILYSKWWFIITILVGLNLFQFGLTKWCLLERVLKKMGVRE